MGKRFSLIGFLGLCCLIIAGCNSAPEEKILGAWERYEPASGFWGPRYYYLIVEKEQFTNNGMVFDCVYGEKDKRITVGPPGRDYVAYVIKVIDDNKINFEGTAGLGGSGEYTRTTVENIEATKAKIEAEKINKEH